MPANNNEDFANDLLWGVDEIARFIRRSRRQTYYLIGKQIVPAEKRGPKIIVASRAKIRKALQRAQEQAAA
jgi:hypothetical protein